MIPKYSFFKNIYSLTTKEFPIAVFPPYRKAIDSKIPCNSFVRNSQKNYLMINKSDFRYLYTNEICPKIKVPSRNLDIYNGRSNSLFQRKILSQNHIRHFSIRTILFIINPLTRTLAVAFGLKFRRWWKSLNPNEKKLAILTLKNNLTMMFFCFGAINGSLLMFYAAHLETDPVSKRKKFVVFTDDQIQEIANTEESIIVAQNYSFLLPKNDPLYQKISNIVQKIVTFNNDIETMRNTKWAVHVIDKPNVRNAFVLPNGSIFVFSGLMSLTSNDDQMGAVLSHEMAHAILGHMAEQISYIHFHHLLFLIPITIIWAIMPIVFAFPSQWFAEQLTRLLVQLPFSRSLEMEADRVGLMLSAKACFDVRQASLFWSKLKVISKLEEEEYGAEPPEFLSTHPSYDRRRQHLEQYMNEALKLRETCNCPVLSKTDPREFVNTLLYDLVEQEKIHNETNVFNTDEEK